LGSPQQGAGGVRHGFERGPGTGVEGFDQDIDAGKRFVEALSGSGVGAEILRVLHSDGIVGGGVVSA
jgi:hypothetical protein